MVNHRGLRRSAALAVGLMLLAGPAALADSPPNVTVQIGDSTYSDWTVTLPVGGTVTWTNVGTGIHTATTPPPLNATSFDTGGLASGQSNTVTFDTPGVFSYSSATDCLNANANSGFNCAGPYNVVVVGPPADGSVATKPAAGPGLTLVPNAVKVTIDDAGGFQPNTLTILAGQSITFVNQGQIVHTAVSDQRANPGFDTGGMDPGKSKTINFAVPGMYAFHSSTEPIWGRDAFGQKALMGYVWNGLITVR